jgi:hypothetical protein
MEWMDEQEKRTHQIDGRWEYLAQVNCEWRRDHDDTIDFVRDANVYTCWMVMRMRDEVSQQTR